MDLDRLKAWYEGTRVTQNVKISRVFWLLARGAVLALGLLALSAVGCDTKRGGTAAAEAGAGGCGGDDCVAGRFTACAKDAECDQAHGFDCVDGECSYACESHSDCIGIGHCESHTIDGQHKGYCVRDAAPPVPGELYTACPNGTECSDPDLCLGAGVGDLDAYCSIDCQRDADCSPGYYCGSLTRAPCNDACDGKLRGSSDPACIPDAQIGDDKPYHCSDLGVVRSVCRQREFCSPCERDADCLAIPNQICARDESGEKICTRLCDPDARSCPWGNAAQCGHFDADVGQATCSHRFGSCHGKGEVCEPCRTNDDCPGGACASSQFTGERWCVNFSTHCACASVGESGTCTGGGCPESPSGLSIQCVGDKSSSLFDICYAANSATSTQLGTSPQTGCWGAQ